MGILPSPKTSQSRCLLGQILPFSNAICKDVPDAAKPAESATLLPSLNAILLYHRPVFLTMIFGRLTTYFSYKIYRTLSVFFVQFRRLLTRPWRWRLNIYKSGASTVHTGPNWCTNPDNTGTNFSLSAMPAAKNCGQMM